MAKDFKKRGVPLDGIGFQTHVSLKFDNPEKLASFAKNLERFAKLGLELHITELDVRLSDSSSGLARRRKPNSTAKSPRSACSNLPAS